MFIKLSQKAEQRKTCCFVSTTEENLPLTLVIVSSDISILQNGARVVFRGTWQDPFLGKITSLLDKIISTGPKFSFGPISDPSLLVPWQPEDYTK